MANLTLQRIQIQPLHRGAKEILIPILDRDDALENGVTDLDLPIFHKASPEMPQHMLRGEWVHALLCVELRVAVENPTLIFVEISGFPLMWDTETHIVAIFCGIYAKRGR